MVDLSLSLEKLNANLATIKNDFLHHLKENNSIVRIYTHLDADGLSSGAILGKSFLREEIPFQITTLRQLEKEEIVKISKNITNNESFIIFSDFGSGQYLELQRELINKKDFNSFLILDHHLPQKISDKNDTNLIMQIYHETHGWHINPYFFGIDGSQEVSGAGMCYYFAKCLNKNNIDLSPIAIVGAIGDIQNQGPNKSFQGLNTLILEDAIHNKLIEVKNDLNFSSIKPINEAIAYSNDISLPGLTKDVNKTLIFLQSLGILIENLDGTIKSLHELKQEEKQKISSAIIEYSSLKLGIEPNIITKKLIINRYLLTNEVKGSELHDASEFSNLLNACGRNNFASVGIAIGMGDRNRSYKKSQEILRDYKKTLSKSLSWIHDNHKIQQKEYIQFFFGEDIIPESIIGTISSMLIFDKYKGVDKSKPIFGLAERKDEKVYKVSGRAHEKIVKKGINLSKAIRDACDLSGLDVLGGGHPPAAGTKIPLDKVDIFLDNCNTVIQAQLQSE